MSSPSLIVTGIIPKDDKWDRMAQVYRACKSANVEMPDEVDEFFGYGEISPDDDGPVADIDEYLVEYVNQESQYSGYDIELAELPSNIKTIRVYQSW